MSNRRAELERLRDIYNRRRASGVEDRYAPFEPANLFRLQRLERDLAGMLRVSGYLPWGARTALDVGCGSGWWLRTLLRWGARPKQLAGVDALPEALTAARAVHPDLALVRGSADLLPFPNSAFDLVSQFTVLSSILDAGVRRAAVTEILRVLRPGGIMLWYDFTVNPTNPDTRAIPRREAVRLFAGCDVAVRSVTLAPPIARLVAPRSWLAAEILESIPLLRSHLLMTARKPLGPPPTARR